MLQECRLLMLVRAKYLNINNLVPTVINQFTSAILTMLFFSLPNACHRERSRQIIERKSLGLSPKLPPHDLFTKTIFIYTSVPFAVKPLSVAMVYATESHGPCHTAAAITAITAITRGKERYEHYSTGAFPAHLVRYP